VPEPSTSATAAFAPPPSAPAQNKRPPEPSANGTADDPASYQVSAQPDHHDAEPDTPDRTGQAADPNAPVVAPFSPPANPTWSTGQAPTETEAAGEVAEVGEAAASGKPVAADRAYPVTQDVALVGPRPSVEQVVVPDVLKEALAQVARPHQVRWAIQTMATLPETVAPRLAHTVAELIDAAAAKSPALAVVVAARSDKTRLTITISDRAPDAVPGRLALGPKPGAVLSLVRRMGATLTASPSAGGSGTDTILALPLSRLMG
jgi:hypothetical protein